MRKLSRQRISQIKHPYKHRARVMVREAIQAGELQRPDRCSKCGAGGKIQAHHTDYSKPLEVEWLCIDCHAKTRSTGSAVMKRYTVFLSPETISQLQRIFKDTGVRPAETIRRAIDAYLRKGKSSR